MIRDLRNYLAGQVVGLTRDEALLDELLKCAFCRVALDREGTDTSALDEDQLAATYHATLAELRQELYLLDLGPDLLLGPSHIARVDSVLRELDLLDPARDVIGDIYEAFVGTTFRGQEGQFFTPKNAVQALVALVAPTAGDTVLDPACGAGSFLLEAARHARLTDAQLPVLHGIDKDAYLVKLAKIHVALQFGEHAQVACTNSLSGIEDLAETTGYGAGSHTVVLTNPPFGAKIVAVTGDERQRFQLAYKWRKAKSNGTYEATAALAANTPPQVLFVERCIDLLAAGGRLGIVLPESTLSNSGHRYMVQHLLRETTPLAVIGMPEALFKTSGKGGTHTKVCLVVCEKAPAERGHQVFMAEARWCGHDSRGLTIDRDDLPEIVERYQAYGAGDAREESRLGFTVPLARLQDLILAPRYHDPEPRRALKRLKASHSIYRVRDLVDEGHLKISSGHEVGKLAYGGGDIPFVRTSDISNWEVKVDPKHGVSDEVYADLAPKQDVQEGDVLMVRDGTYLIGTCAMLTKHDVRIVYQSHLLKLRTEEGAPLDRYLLLAALSSPPVRDQIRAKSFTLDIIDSLGDRVLDLELAVPRDRVRRDEISSMVRTVIADRVEARELARRAAAEIASND